MHDVIHCRLCLAKVNTVLELTPTPIANNFAKSPDKFAMRFPLSLRQCPSCGHVQQGLAVDGETLFSDYRYATPEAERPRLAALAKSLAEKYPQALITGKYPSVIEIGSNNNIYTDELRKAGFYAIGVDPSPLAPVNGMPKWFNSKTARQMEMSMGQMKMIVANNVFAHVDDLRNVFVGIRTLLAPDGVVVFEVQYLPDMVRGGMFDMIYHEHKDHHTLSPLPRFLAKFGMYVSEVEHIGTHGGSIRVHVRKGEPGPEMTPEVIDWADFSARIASEKNRIRHEFLNYRTIAAFGATAKATTLIHHFDLVDRISYCIDETPSKKGLYLPGTGIQITDEIGEPDAILLTAWNYAEILRPRFKVPLIVPFEQHSHLKAA